MGCWVSPESSIGSLPHETSLSVRGFVDKSGCFPSDGQHLLVGLHGFRFHVDCNDCHGQRCSGRRFGCNRCYWHGHPRCQSQSGPYTLSLVTAAGTPPNSTDNGTWIFDDVYYPTGSPYFVDNPGLLFTDSNGNTLNLYSVLNGDVASYYLTVSSPGGTEYNPGDPGILGSGQLSTRPLCRPLGQCCWRALLGSASSPIEVKKRAWPLSRPLNSILKSKLETPVFGASFVWA